MRIDLAKYLDARELQRLKRSLPKAKRYYAERQSVDDDDQFGIGGNTFRAFRGVAQPSRIYRSWAGSTLKSRQFRDHAINAKSPKQFDVFHSSLCNSLIRHWRRNAKKPLLLAHKYKLVDLFIKYASRLDFDDESVNRHLIRFGHLPIDSRAITGLNMLLSGMIVGDSHTMGSVKTESAYQFLQDVTNVVMAHLGAPILCFDYFAWNEAAEKAA